MRIIVCTGKTTPTANEYKELADALGMTTQVRETYFF
jgi:hypothetical protein